MRQNSFYVDNVTQNLENTFLIELRGEIEKIRFFESYKNNNKNSSFKEHKMYSGQRSRRIGGETRNQAISEDSPFKGHLLYSGRSGRKYGGWRMIRDDRDERLEIEKSQKTLPLRSINSIPVEVEGNIEAGG